jgi:molybdopterin synthase sulfur carrier subunit
MQANLYATFRLLAGVKSVDLDLPPGASIQQAIHALVTRYPVLHRHWLVEQEELYSHVQVFLNGQAVETLADGLDTCLQPGDSLDFFPPVAGGA